MFLQNLYNCDVLVVKLRKFILVRHNLSLATGIFQVVFLYTIIKLLNPKPYCKILLHNIDIIFCILSHTLCVNG